MNVETPPFLNPFLAILMLQLSHIHMNVETILVARHLARE